MCDSCSTITCVLERRGRHHAQKRLLKRIQTVPMDVDSLHRKGGKGKNGKGKGKNKGERNKHDGKGKGEQSAKQRHFDGYCNQCGEHGHKKPDCAGKNKFFNGTCNKCEADCPFKTVGHLESETL